MLIAHHINANMNNMLPPEMITAFVISPEYSNLFSWCIRQLQIRQLQKTSIIIIFKKFKEDMQKFPGKDQKSWVKIVMRGKYLIILINQLDKKLLPEKPSAD